VSYPFRRQAGKTFWGLWTPFDAYENGYQEFPDLLRESFIVEARFQEVLSTEAERLNDKSHSNRTTVMVFSLSGRSA
jgi:hypothetical protein